MNKSTFKQFDQKHSKKPETKKNKDPTPRKMIYDPRMARMTLIREPSLSFNMIWTELDSVYIDGDNITVRELEQQYRQISRRQNEHNGF